MTHPPPFFALKMRHFVKLQMPSSKLQRSYQYAVAALPAPVAIIDSRGEHLTTNFLQSLTWIKHSGETSTPPRFGQRMKAFYFVPQQSKSSSP